MFGSELAMPALLVAGAAAIAMFSRRFGGFFQPRAARRGLPRHLGTLMLNPKCSVALVEAGKQTLLLGVTASSVTLLARLPAAEGDAGAGEEEIAEERLQ